MNLFRPAVLALSAALMFSIGSSSSATTNYSHPAFSVADDRTLSLREAGSKIVMETIEDAVRQGGVALLGEGFQLDSSLTYEFGKDEDNVEGELDIVLPLLNFEEHAVFLQPGAVFWTGLEDEERADGNIGLVYRANLTEDVIGGISVFYDHDFRIGHSRVGGGMDLQSGWLRTAFNYYHPLSDTQDGREGYVEDALQGGDARLVIEREVIRVGGSIGYWKFQGEDDRDEWEFSYSLDAGFRFLPGLFLEGGWEGHDADKSLDERWNIGWAFRFSLPDFEGASYGGREMSASLHKVVEREKRILYEEREANSPIQLTPVDESGQPLTLTSTIEEGSTVTIAGQLEALAEPVMLNLVIDEDASSADLGSDFNYGHAVYVLNEGTGEQSAPGTVTDCPVARCVMMVPAGVTRFDVEIEILDDDNAAPREIPEEIVLQVHVPEEHQGAIRNGETTVTIRAHGNTIEFAPDAATTLAEDNVEMGVEVSVNIDMASPMAITLNVEPDGMATAGTDYTITPSTLTIPAGEASATLTLRGINNQIGEGSKTITLTLSGNLPEGWDFGPVTDPANPPATITHSMMLLDDDLAVGFATPGTGDAFNPVRIFEENPTNGMQHGVTVRVESTQQAPTGGFDLEWEVMSGEGDDQVDSTSGSVNFPANESHKDFTIMIDNDTTSEGETPVTVRLSTPTSLPTGWNFGVQEYTFTIETSDAGVTFSGGADAMVTANEGDTLTFEVTTTQAAPSTGIPISVSSAVGEDIQFGETVTIPAGQSSQSFTVEIVDDAVAEESAETYTVRISQGPGFPHSWGAVAGSRTITINPSDLPMASLNLVSSPNVAASSFNRMRIELSETLNETVMVNITGTTDDLSYDKDVMMVGSWRLQYNVLPANTTAPNFFDVDSSTTCDNATTANPCVIEIPQGRTLVDMRLTISGGASGNDVTVTLGITSAAMTKLIVNPSSAARTLTVQ